MAEQLGESSRQGALPHARVSLPKPTRERQVCRYYDTPRGCFAQNNCRFLHGRDTTEPPSEQHKTCRYFAKGFCLRGSKCWYKHDLETTSTTSQDSDRGKPVTLNQQSLVNVSSQAAQEDNEELACGICLETPIQFGLLTGCSHVFCLDCLRNWRDPAGKEQGLLYNNIIKTCPLCRVDSKFITPSSQFFAHGSKQKEDMIASYKASMARIDCKYFMKSGTRKFCPFGKDCFYRHLNEDGTAHEFPHGVDHYMRLNRARQARLERERIIADLGNFEARLRSATRGGRTTTTEEAIASLLDASLRLPDIAYLMERFALDGDDDEDGAVFEVEEDEDDWEDEPYYTDGLFLNHLLCESADFSSSYNKLTTMNRN